MKTYLAGLLLLGMLTYSVGAARADLINDGGFEADQPFSSTGSPTPSSGFWTFSGAPLGSDAGVNRNQGGPGAGAHSGSNWYAYGGSGDTISQTVQTQTGTMYTLTYWVALTGSSGGYTFEATWNSAPFTTNRGSSLIVVTSGSSSFTYQEYTAIVTGTGPSGTLSFLGADGGGGGFLELDDVSLLPPVPEPSSMALCGLGALGFIVPAGWKWRRQKKAAATVPAPAA
jgi:hypothetical protein